jgi:hypothetical protein
MSAHDYDEAAKAMAAGRLEDAARGFAVQLARDPAHLPSLVAQRGADDLHLLVERHLTGEIEGVAGANRVRVRLGWRTQAGDIASELVHGRMI